MAITYTPTRKYEVDRIIAARRSGSGWKVTVKWKGYVDPTDEPLSRVLADSKHDKDILRDVERCKADYLAMHPHARTEEESEELARDAFAVSADDESPHAFWARMFDEYGPGHPDDVPDGTEQRVYWVNGSTIVRHRIAGAWEYSVVDDARDAFAISPDDATAPTQGTDRLQFKVYGACDTVETSQILIAQIERCREASQLRCRAMNLLLPDSLVA